MSQFFLNSLNILEYTRFILCSSWADCCGRPGPTCLRKILQAWEHHSAKVNNILDMSYDTLRYSWISDRISWNYFGMSWNIWKYLGKTWNVLKYLGNLGISWKQHLLRWTISSHVDRGICQKGFSQWRKDVWRMQNLKPRKQYSADAPSQKSQENAKIHSLVFCYYVFSSDLPSFHVTNQHEALKFQCFRNLVAFCISERWQYFWCFASQSPNAAISFSGVLLGTFSCSFKTIYFILPLLRQLDFLLKQAPWTIWLNFLHINVICLSIQFRIVLKGTKFWHKQLFFICAKTNMSTYHFLSREGSPCQDGSLEILRSSNGLSVQKLWNIWTTIDHTGPCA